MPTRRVHRRRPAPVRAPILAVALPAALAVAVAAVAAAPRAAAAQQAATASAASAPAAPAAAGHRATLERLVHHTVLPNGLLVVVVENHAVPLATVNVVVRNGAFTQREGEQGVAHLFEHMLFEGYTDPAEMPFRYAAADLSASYNGTTGAETVSYYVTLPASNAERGVALLARLMRRPRFADSTLNRERAVVFGEFQRNVSEPEWYLRHEVETRLWGAGYGRKNTIGTGDDLLATKAARLQKLFETYYVPNNAAVVITGDVSAPALLEAARRHFGGWDRRPDPFVANPIPAFAALDDSQGVLVTHKDARGVTVRVEFPGPSVRADAAGSYAADIFAALVNAPGSGMQERLVESGLFDDVELAYESLNHTGPLTIEGRTSRDRLARALPALKAEIRRFADSGYVADDELAAAKKRVAVNAAFELERSSGLAHTIGYWWSVAGLDYYLGYTDSMAASSPAALRGFAARYLTYRPRVAGVLVTPADAAGAMEHLDIFTAPDFEIAPAATAPQVHP